MPGRCPFWVTSWQQIQHLFDILRLNIEMRRGAHPARALGGDDRTVTQAGADRGAVDSLLAETYDACVGLAQHFIALLADAVNDLTGQAAHLGRNLIDADSQQKIDGRAQSVAADGIERPAFVASGIRPQRHVAARVIVIAGDVGPAKLHRFHLLLQAPGDVEDAATLRPYKPLVTIGSQRVDVGGLDIYWKRAQT